MYEIVQIFGVIFMCWFTYSWTQIIKLMKNYKLTHEIHWTEKLKSYSRRMLYKRAWNGNLLPYMIDLASIAFALFFSMDSELYFISILLFVLSFFIEKVTIKKFKEKYSL